MVISCSACGCTYTQKTSSGISFHRFPLNNPTLLERWAVAVQRKNWHPTKNSFLCSRHFPQECFVVDEHAGRKALLKDDAVPYTFSFDSSSLKQRELIKQHTSKNVQRQYHSEMKIRMEGHCQNKGNNGTIVEAERIDSHYYCRLCASQNIQEMFEIFSEEDENLYIAEKIGRCLPIIVLPSDKLPLHICQSCMNKLNTSYDLIITALQAEEFLKEEFLEIENLQTSSKSHEENLIKAESNISRGQKLDVYEKGMVCKIVLEDNGSVKIERLIKDECDLKDDDAGKISCGESLDEVFNRECQEKFENASSLDLIDNSLLPPINIEGPTTCDMCNITYLDMEAFDQHVLNFHFVKYKQKCRLCDEGFEEPKDLLAHKVLKHPENIMACEKCNLKIPNYNKEFSNKKNMKNSGDNCIESFANRKMLNDLTPKHEFVVQNRKTFHRHHHFKPKEQILQYRKIPEKYIFEPKEKCAIQLVSSVQNNGNEKTNKNQEIEFYSKDKSKKTNSNVPRNTLKKKATEAMIKQKQRSSMQCVTCHKVFTNMSFYKRHRYIHDPAYWDQYKCKVCKRPFRDSQTLKDHMHLHFGLKPHMCDLCGRTYNRFANMLKHRKLHKPSNQWEHLCNHCQARFEKINDLMAHIERSHGSGVIDDDGESNKDTNKQVKWICRFCGKRVSSKLSLQDHERIHTGIKPFVCEWCGREFRSKPNLMQHHLTHTGIRKHSCAICGKKFARKSFVVQHMRVHTGERPFECNICGQRFTQSGDMRRHERRHHVEVNTYFVDVPTEDNTILLKVRTSC